MHSMQEIVPIPTLRKYTRMSSTPIQCPTVKTKLSILMHVFVFVSGKTYFFKGQYFYEFNDKKMRVKKGYPKLIRNNWLGCDTKYSVAGEIKANDSENTASLSTPSILTSLLTLCICMWRP